MRAENREIPLFLCERLCRKPDAVSRGSDGGKELRRL